MSEVNVIETALAKERVSRTETRPTRWGDVTYTYEPIDEIYGRHVYEGPRGAVLVQVADGLRGTTERYEHMFRIDSMSPHPDAQKARSCWIRVECLSSNYAGD